MIVPAHLFQQLLPTKQVRKCDSATTDLRAELSRALKAERFKQALELYELIEKRKPEEPRWAHRKGDLLRRMGRSVDAVVAYERAVHLYSRSTRARARCSNGCTPKPRAGPSARTAAPSNSTTSGGRFGKSLVGSSPRRIQGRVFLSETPANRR